MQNNNGAIKIRALRKPHVTRQIQNINSAASLSNALRAFSLLQMPTCDTEKIAAQLGDKICKFFIKYMEWTKKSESNLEYLNTDGAESIVSLVLIAQLGSLEFCLHSMIQIGQSK